MNQELRIMDIKNKAKSIIHDSLFTIHSRGFTLIELLIVIAVIGVLASSLFFVVNPVTQFQKARDASRKSDLTQIQKALELYYFDNNVYPASDNNKIKDKDGATIEWGNSWPSYMATIPKDPVSSQSYFYQSPSDGSWYMLYAKLEYCSDAQAIEPGSSCGDYNYSITSPNISVLAFDESTITSTPPPAGTPTIILTPTPTPDITCDDIPVCGRDLTCRSSSHDCTSSCITGEFLCSNGPVFNCCDVPTSTPTPTPTNTPTPTPTSTPMPTPTFVPKRVFVTSATYTGDLLAAGKSKVAVADQGFITTGLQGADAICQWHAGRPSPPLGGTWIAWLSSDMISAASRIVRERLGPYKRVDGALIANDWNDFFTVKTGGNYLRNLIDKDEEGLDIKGDDKFVHTNTNPNGSPITNSCTNWTYGGDNLGFTSYVGYVDYLTNWWTTAGYVYCKNLSRLYCFEQ